MRDEQWRDLADLVATVRWLAQAHRTAGLDERLETVQRRLARAIDEAQVEILERHNGEQTRKKKRYAWSHKSSATCQRRDRAVRNHLRSLG